MPDCFRLRSPDGQCLILSSRDGYCTIVVFDEILPAHHTQQNVLQLQSIAHQHSVPLTHTTSISSSSVATPAATPASMSSALPPTPIVPMKRSEPPLTPSTSLEDAKAQTPKAAESEAEAGAEKQGDEPPKKKRRVALTHVGELDP